MRPSEYTAALIQVLQAKPRSVRGAKVLEIGSGSGVVLAALGELGAASLVRHRHRRGCRRPRACCCWPSLATARRRSSTVGDMWLPVAGRRFDLIVANLPHFPMERSDVPGRLPTWSAGGTDGRALARPFPRRTGRRIWPPTAAPSSPTTPSSTSTARARSWPGSACRSALRSTTLVYIPDDKLARMTASVLAAQDGRTIHRYGPYAFGEMHIVEIVRHEVAEQ